MKSWMKTSRIGLIALLVVGMAAFGVEAVLLTRNTAGESFYTTRDREKQETVDRLVFLDTPEAFSDGSMRHVLLADDPPRISLDHVLQKRAAFPREGFWTTKQTPTEFPFTEFLPSWNLFAPPGTGVLFSVRTRDQATQEWSPWMRIGSWGRVDEKDSTMRTDFG